MFYFPEERTVEFKLTKHAQKAWNLRGKVNKHKLTRDGTSSFSIFSSVFDIFNSSDKACNSHAKFSALEMASSFSA